MTLRMIREIEKNIQVKKELNLNKNKKSVREILRFLFFSLLNCSQSQGKLFRFFYGIFCYHLCCGFGRVSGRICYHNPGPDSQISVEILFFSLIFRI